MLTDELYSSFDLISLNELTDTSILQTFTCSQNKDLQHFLHNTALDFENRDVARTYLLLDTSNGIHIVGYFTILIKVISTDGISKSKIKEISGISKDERCIKVLLIGQLGLDDLYMRKGLGDYLLQDAISLLEEVHTTIGGRYIMVDAVNCDKVIALYERNDFVKLHTSEQSDDAESIRMILRF